MRRRPFLVRITRSALALAILAGIAAGHGPEAAVRLLAEAGDVIDGKTIVDFNTGGSVFSPAINNAGVVAFGASFDGPALQNTGIFTENSQIFGANGDVVFRPDINHTGTVAFNTGGTISTQFGPVVQIGDVIGGLSLISIREPAINDLGEILFGSGTSDGSQGIFISDSTSNSVLVTTGDVIDGKTLGSWFINGSVIFNNSGAVAFRAVFEGPEPLADRNAIFSPTELLVKIGDVIDGRTLIGMGSFLSMNASGEIAFRGSVPNGSGIFTQNRLILETPVTIDGILVQPVLNATINDAGNIAFKAFIENGLGGEGLFTEECLIARTGDVVDGRTITGFGSSLIVPKINNAGDVAFYAEFEGGSGIFLFENGCSVAVSSAQPFGLVALSLLIMVCLAVSFWRFAR